MHTHTGTQLGYRCFIMPSGDKSSVCKTKGSCRFTLALTDRLSSTLRLEVFQKVPLWSENPQKPHVNSGLCVLNHHLVAGGSSRKHCSSSPTCLFWHFVSRGGDRQRAPPSSEQVPAMSCVPQSGVTGGGTLARRPFLLFTPVASPHVSVSANGVPLIESE